MEKKYIKYMITAAVGIILSMCVFMYKNIFIANSLSEITLILSDGFLLSGVMIFGTGALIFVSNNGVFDVIVYGVKKFGDTFKKEYNKDKDLPKTFYDYKERKQRKSPFGFMLLTGSAFLSLAVSFNLIFSFV